MNQPNIDYRPDAVERLTRERDEYADQVQTLHERVQHMTSAASSAAASTVIAIEKIQKLMVVVDAAIAWRESADESGIDEHLSRARELRIQVDRYLVEKRSRS